MAFFQTCRSRKALREDVDACRREIDELRRTLDGLRQEIDGDLEQLRKDFHEIILLLKESAADDTGEAPAPAEPHGGEAPVPAQPDGGASPPAAEWQRELAALEERVDGVDRQAARLGETLQTLGDTVDSGFNEMKKQLNDARKDIANRISYAVSRLRT